MTYWKNRIEQEIKARQKAEYSLDVRLNDLYDRYIREIEKEINDFYTRYALKNSVSVSEAKKRVSEMDVQAFSSKAKQYVKEKNFGKTANEELAVYNLKMRVSRLQMLQYNIDLQLLGLSKEETKLAGEYLNQEYKREIKTQAGILGEMMENPAQMKLGMDTILNTPFHGVTWKTGLKEQQDAIRQVVAKATEDLIVKGKNPTTYISKLTKDMKIKRYEAKRLLATEGARMQTEVQKATYIENDFEEYRFIAETAKCKICQELGDKIFKVKDMQPGKNACPMHPHCRCSTAPYFDRQKAIEKLKEKYKDDEELVKSKEDKTLTKESKSKPVLYRPKLEKLKDIVTVNTNQNIKHYESVKDRWLANVDKNKAKVTEKKSFTVGDVKYKVDGKNVVLDYSKKEKEVAEWVANTFGKHVELIPRINNPEGIKTPDYLVDGVKFDLKEITGNGKNVIDGNLRKVKKQSENIIFDVTESSLSIEEVLKQLNHVYQINRRGLKVAVVKKNEKIIDILKKKE